MERLNNKKLRIAIPLMFLCLLGIFFPLIYISDSTGQLESLPYDAAEVQTNSRKPSSKLKFSLKTIEAKLRMRSTLSQDIFKTTSSKVDGLQRTNVFITCDNLIKGVYQEVDDSLLPLSISNGDSNNSANWRNVDAYEVLVGVPLAVECENDLSNGITNNAAGLLASFTQGKVSDNSWKCHNNFEEGWNKSNFDDSEWKEADVVANNGDQPWGRVSGISRQAKWIWASDPQPHRVFCRIIV